MPIGIPSQDQLKKYVQTNTTGSTNNTSNSSTGYLSGSDLLRGNNTTTTDETSKAKDTKIETNNKDSNSKIIGRGLKELLPSVAKGVTSAIDAIADAPSAIVASIADNAANNDATLRVSANKAIEKVKADQAKHILGDKVQSWEQTVDARQQAIATDNPDSKLAQTVYKGTELAESVGRMIPSIAVSAATAGVGGAVTKGATAAANIVSRTAEAAGLATMFGDVYSTSLKDSTDQGHDYTTSSNKAFRDALTEVGTELLFGGIAGTGKALITPKNIGSIAEDAAVKGVRTKLGDKLAGSTVAKGIEALNKFGSTKVGNFLIGDIAEDGLGGIVGEAIEEMISEVVGPYNERATTNPEAANATLGEVLEAGLGGAIISAIFGGAQGVANKVQSTKKTIAEKKLADVYEKWQNNPRETLRQFSALQNGVVAGEAQKAFSKLSSDLNTSDYEVMALPRVLKVELPTNIDALTDAEAQAAVDEAIPKLANAYKQYAKLSARAALAKQYRTSLTSDVLSKNAKVQEAQTAYQDAINKASVAYTAEAVKNGLTPEQYAELKAQGIDIEALNTNLNEAKKEAYLGGVDTDIANAIAQGNAEEIYGKDLLDKYNANLLINEAGQTYYVGDGPDVYEFKGYFAVPNADGNIELKTTNQLSQERFGANFSDLTEAQKKVIADLYKEQEAKRFNNLKEAVEELNTAISESGYNSFRVKIASDEDIAVHNGSDSYAWWSPVDSTIYMNPYRAATKNCAYSFFAHEATHKIVDDLEKFDNSGFAKKTFFNNITNAMEVSEFPIEETREKLREVYYNVYYNDAYRNLSEDKVVAKTHLDKLYKDTQSLAGSEVQQSDIWKLVAEKYAEDRMNGFDIKDSDGNTKHIDSGVEEELIAKYIEKLFGSSQLMGILTDVSSATMEELYSAVKQSSIADYKFNRVFADTRVEILSDMVSALKSSVTGDPISSTQIQERQIDPQSNINSEGFAPYDLPEGFKDTDISGVSEERMRQYEELREKMGLNKGTSIPGKINKHVATSRTAGRLIDNEQTPNQLRGAMINDLVDGILGHLIMTDDASLDYVQRQMGQYSTFEEAVPQLISIFDSGRAVNKNDLALGQQLILDLGTEINRANIHNAEVTDPSQMQPTEGLVDMAEQLIAKVCAAGTRAGQNLQAMALIKKMTPTGRLYYLEAQVEQYISEMVDRRGNSRVGGFQFKTDAKGKILRDENGNPIRISIPENLKEKMLACTTQKQMDDVQSEIAAAIAEQVSTKLTDRIVAWRYLSMLGNPRTHVRNIVSNIAMGGLVNVKDTIKGMIEDTVFKEQKTGRTATSKRIDPALKKAYQELAIRDWDNNGVSDEALAGGKVGFQSMINEKRNKFGKNGFGKVLNELDKLNSHGIKEGTLLGGLEGEDYWSGKKAYVQAFVKYCAANGLDVDYLQAGTVESNTALAQARSYAVTEAAKATYHDANNLAQHLNQIEKQNGALGKIIVGGLVPFKKTPGNILKRGIEYSPLGLAQGAVELVRASRTKVEDYESEYSALTSEDALNINNSNDKFDANKAYKRFDATAKRTRAICDAIDRLCSGLTGTGIMMLGVVLGSMGILKGSGSDNDREEYYDQMLGNQEYSINIAGKNYTLDWLTPSCMPLFAGVAISDMFAGDMDLSAGDILTGLSKIADPVMNLSVLQGINDAITSYDSGLGKVALSAAEGYIGQLIPTLAAQIARTIDPTRRTTYAPTDDNNGASKEFNTFINRMANKIPFASMSNQEYVDMWGRTESRGESFIGRLFSQSVAPWYEKNKTVTQADDLVAQVYQATGDRGVIPTSPESSYQFDNEVYRLSEQDYHDTKVTVGELSYIGVSSLSQIPGFYNLTAEQQADIIANVYSFARKVCKSDYAYANNIAYKEDSSTTRIKEAVVAGLSIGEAIYVNYLANQMTADKDANGKTINGSKKAKVLALYQALGLTADQIQAISQYDFD